MVLTAQTGSFKTGCVGVGVWKRATECIKVVICILQGYKQQPREQAPAVGHEKEAAAVTAVFTFGRGRWAG